LTWLPGLVFFFACSFLGSQVALVDFTGKFPVASNPP
jgi:hypothetical protein